MPDFESFDESFITPCLLSNLSTIPGFRSWYVPGSSYPLDLALKFHTTEKLQVVGFFLARFEIIGPFCDFSSAPMAGFQYFVKTMPRSAEDYGAGLRLGMGRVEEEKEEEEEEGCWQQQKRNEPLVQLDLLPLGSSHRESSSAALPSSWTGTCDGGRHGGGGGIDMNQIPSPADFDDDAVVSSPNSTVSSFQMGPGSHATSGNKRERDDTNNSNSHELERACSRASDEEDGETTRKKLRLSKEQSALLEESFKEHNTLNPKQKLALAKQLSLRPRQVEVWFQNRRARTKLKQTEVDCEFLKRCCESLTEENRRLQKEVQELRALKVSHPFYMQLPAATLTMCPSCERVATADTHTTLSPWQALAPNTPRTLRS